MNPLLSAKINQLRAIAALWVFIFHYGHFIAHAYFAPMASLNPLNIIIYNGYIGVSLFFGLSGFLFSRVYRANADFNVAAFYIKRLLRILPSFLVVVVFFILFLNAQHHPLQQLFTLIFYYDALVYPQTIRHLWSINRELYCYAAFPLLWLMARYGGIKALTALGGGSLSLVILWAIQTQPILPNFYASLGLRFFEFILGMLAGLCFKPNAAQRYALPMFLLVYVALLTALHAATWQVPLAYSLLGIIGLCVNSVLCVLFIVLYLHQPTAFPVCLTKPLEKIGEVSYSFYLYHFLVIGFFAEHRQLLSPVSAVNFTLLLCVSLSIAFIGYHLIEQPFLKLKMQRFNGR
ncbi:MAG: acyltransferase [Methylococcaceae bacterium]|nr:acyltransferase [Methylococcaceae bacterium]